MTIATPVKNPSRLMATKVLVRALQDAEDNAADDYRSKGWSAGRVNAPQDIAVIQIVQEVTRLSQLYLEVPDGGYIQAAFFAIYTADWSGRPNTTAWCSSARGALSRAQLANHLPEALEKFFSLDRND